MPSAARHARNQALDGLTSTRQDRPYSQLAAAPDKRPPAVRPPHRHQACHDGVDRPHQGHHPGRTATSSTNMTVIPALLLSPTPGRRRTATLNNGSSALVNSADGCVGDPLVFGVLLPPVGVERTTLVTLRKPRSAGMAVPGTRVSQGPLPQTGNALRTSSPHKMPGPMHLLYSVCHSNATRRK
jgi:hypothetical protein